MTMTMTMTTYPYVKRISFPSYRVLAAMRDAGMFRGSGLPPPHRTEGTLQILKWSIPAENPASPIVNITVFIARGAPCSDAIRREVSSAFPNDADEHDPACDKFTNGGFGNDEVYVFYDNACKFVDRALKKHADELSAGGLSRWSWSGRWSGRWSWSA